MSVPSGGWFGRFKMNVSIVGAIEHIRSAMDAMVSGSQRLLGHAPSTKSKYKMASFRQRAEKKRVKVLSVSLYLMFVMSSAIVMCIYYALFWRPCTSKIFFHNDVTSPENNRCCAYSESWRVSGRAQSVTWRKVAVCVLLQVTLTPSLDPVTLSLSLTLDVRSGLRVERINSEK
ncbi:uncharacterized protein LOC128243164 isoform X1 [Mya arenaria]|uniref:uncharacterized protein LOC128243164 isoform X1 n=1 Tax=Mya arenaria TaxID=6604 RepID=UPI0022E900F8|nr:uncharacterized protein LOC128243164 isoform X1 [Mya arenaria]